MGGALGLAVAWLALRALVAASPADLPCVSEIGLDAMVLLFNLGVALATGLVFGALPALQASRIDIEAALKEEGHAMEGAGRSRKRIVRVLGEWLAIALHTTGATAALAKPAEAAVREIDHDLPVHSVRMMDEIIYGSFASGRFSTTLFALFGALAVLLVSVGIYGIASFAVTQRMHEIGIRVALGARPTHVVRLVLGVGLRLTIAGVVIGVGAALALSRLMASMLFGVTPTDPLTFGLVAAGLVLVALAAAAAPTLRALGVDPATMLRSE